MKSFVFFVAGILVGTLLLHTATAQNPRTTGLNHTGMVVENYDEAFAFYTEALGFREAYTIRRDDGSPILTYLQLNRDTFVELIPAGAGQPSRITHFGVEVASIDTAVQRLRDNGVTVADPGLTPANARFVRVQDPNGIEIEIMEFGPESLQRKAIESWQP